jgi:hypothetical protein
MQDNYASVIVPAQQSDVYVDFPQLEPLLVRINGAETEAAGRLQLAAGEEQNIELWF